MRVLSQMCRVLSRRAGILVFVSDVAVGCAIALAAFMWTYFGLALGRIPGFRVDRTGVAIIGRRHGRDGRHPVGPAGGRYSPSLA